MVYSRLCKLRGTPVALLSHRCCDGELYPHVSYYTYFIYNVSATRKNAWYVLRVQQWAIVSMARETT